MRYTRSPTALFLLAKLHQKGKFNSAPPFFVKRNPEKNQD
jgi:hypothetical protein